MGKKIGDSVDPLLVSVRSGAKFSMPGMMDTVLNLGLNDQSVDGLAKQTDDERFAYDSYRRFIAMYGRIVLGIEAEPFDRLLDTAKEWDGVTSDSAVSADTLRRLCERYKDVVKQETGKRVPARPDRSSCAAPSKRSSRVGAARVRSRTATVNTSATNSAPR